MDCAAPSRYEDVAALDARRERLRAFAADVAETVEAIAMPETFLEGERAVRTVTIADRILARLPDTPEVRSPARLRLRGHADRLLDAVYALPKPDTFLEAYRAGRFALAADTMLSQLYEQPKSGSDAMTTMTNSTRCDHRKKNWTSCGAASWSGSTN